MRRKVIMNRLIGALALVMLLAACSSNNSPTATNPRTPVMTLQVSPNPLPSTFKGRSGTTLTFELSATVTFRESSGVSGTITQVVGTVVRQPGGQSSGGPLSVNLRLPAAGAVIDTYTQPFDISDPVDSVVWRVTASGSDAQGRAFSATSADIVVNPPSGAGSPMALPGRLALWGR
jgi:hypothetical protein